MNSINANLLEFLSLYGTTGKVFLLAYSFLIGACFGSFSTACVWRIPRGISILWPPSSCPKCGHRITPLENIPIFSWIFLRGKCSSCGLPISPRYVLLETATALLFLFSAWSRMHFDPEHLLCVVQDWILIVFAMACASTDLELRIIPNKFTCTAVVLGLLTAPFCLPGLAGNSFRFDNTPQLYQLLKAGTGMGWGAAAVCAAAISGLAVLIFFFCAAFAGKLLFHREAFGLGDVKMLTAAAVFDGVFATLLVTMGACLLSLVWIVLDRIGKKHFRRQIPFGPFIAAALVLWIFLRPLFPIPPSAD